MEVFLTLELLMLKTLPGSFPSYHKRPNDLELADYLTNGSNCK